MLDIRLFRDNADDVRQRLATRGVPAESIDSVLAMDEQRRSLIANTETLKARRNEISKLIPQKAKAKEPIDALKDESRAIGEEITATDQKLQDVQARLDGLLAGLPNLPAPDTPVGKDEGENVEVRAWGQKREFAFAPKPHWELGDELGQLDLPRGAKVTGSGFYVLRGTLARLERVLIQWMLDTHTSHNGYTEVSVPFVANRGALFGTSQLPKFEDQLYRIESEDFFLVPTAEVPVTNLYAQEIVEPEQLPIALCAHTPCFRSEAGAAGRENRGISRIHQFHKVELVHITRPEESEATHERLVGHATALLEALELPYRVLQLCTGDMGFAAQKCFDLELWAPGMDTWLEVSSCSNFGDFQARRANMRYRPAKGEKPRFVHTLNGSGLALPRLMIALMENNQQEDGTIKVPPVLQERLGAAVIG